MDKYTYLWTRVKNRFLPLDICNENYSYEDIFRMKAGDIERKCQLSKTEALYIYNKYSEINIDKEYDEFLSSKIKVAEYGKEGYPERLLSIDNPPRALFYYGSLPDEGKKSVSIIGARKCSEYGRIMAEKISSGLAEYGIQIISGMAIGIDGIAQMCALNAGGKTFSILGSGVDICYPRANKGLYERLKKEGGVISEYPDKSPAASENFPQRNRIISALCDVLIVIEAKVKSGTMITVDNALSQGKEIMVVPGRATDILSTGCNALIYQGAYPVQCPEDVLFLLGECDNREENKVEENSLIKKLSDEEREVYNALDYYPVNAEMIADKINRSFYDTVAILLSLEMKELVEEKGKSYYVRKI